MSELLTLLERELRLDARSIQKLILTAPERYKVYTIPKRTGGRREIAHPASELKAAQRIIMRHYLAPLYVHPAATAYVEGSSIRRNAQFHASNRVILKFDFENFFPSITEQAWLSYCEHHKILSREDAIRAGRILFRRPKGGRILRLSIGAPSSPMLSNILMAEFDKEIHSRVSKHKVTYTRYADDLTFSAERVGNLAVVESIIRSVLYRISSPKLRLNEKKTVLATPRARRRVTGLILTLDGRVSIGRERKRMLRAAIDHFRKGELTRRREVKLAGEMAFVQDVEPEFYTRMERAYGKDVMKRLKLSVRGYVRSNGK